MALLVFCSELHLFAKALGARRQLVECRGSAWHGCRDATLLYAEALGVIPQIENLVSGLHRRDLREAQLDIRLGALAIEQRHSPALGRVGEWFDPNLRCRRVGEERRLLAERVLIDLDGVRIRQNLHCVSRHLAQVIPWGTTTYRLSMSE